MTGVRTETTPTAITTGTGQGARAHVPTGASYPRRSNTPTRRAGTDPRDQGVSMLVAGTMAADRAAGGMAAADTAAAGTAVAADTAAAVGTAAAAGTAVAADTAAAAGTAADTAVAADTAAAVGTVAAGTAVADTDESVIVTETSPGTTRRMCILYNFLMFRR
jgi:hypothetical protein